MSQPIPSANQHQAPADRLCAWPIASSEVLADGPVIAMVRDTVTTPDGESMVRDYITHPGSVVIIAVDAEDQLILIEQYRHPVGHRVVEAPAGLLDEPGEEPMAAAQRELAEEAGLQAAHWSPLVQLFASPGCSQETTRVYLATGLSAVEAPQGFVAADEEADMTLRKVPLTAVMAQILAGEIRNPGLVAGVLALYARRSGFEDFPQA